ncbi:hypothetical protein ALP75_203869 [Pseudomonas syringae pv. actinidiae]|nr:hypothetical protein ALP75_203869 [Pseudomonas syringae pv. actinidiae]
MSLAMTDLSHPKPPSVSPDKRQVAASFSRAAGSYDSVAELQRSVGSELLSRLPAGLTPSRWLDLGCGTGPAVETDDHAWTGSVDSLASSSG